MRVSKFHFLLLSCLLSVSLLTAQDHFAVQSVGQIYNHWDQINEIEFYGDYCLVAAGISGLQILDVSDPANPAEVSSFGQIC